MKIPKILFVALAIVVVLCVSGLVNSARMAQPGMVASYKFDEGRGNILTDTSGNGNDGTIYGATWVEGKAGPALEFDGIDDYVEVIPNSSLNMGSPVTVSLWIMPKALPKSHSGYLEYDLVVLNKGSFATSDGNWFLGVSNKSVAFSFKPLDGYGWQKYTAETGEISVNTWHFLAVTHSGEDLRFYLDGKLVKESKQVEKMAEGSHPLRIGSYEWNDYYFCGLINETKIYNRALSPNEVRGEYKKRLK
jgi:hypothetical protein